MPGLNAEAVPEETEIVVHSAAIPQTHPEMVAARALGCELPAQFSTGDIAIGIDRPRWLAQRVAYCLRETGAAGGEAARGGRRAPPFAARLGLGRLLGPLRGRRFR